MNRKNFGAEKRRIKPTKNFSNQKIHAAITLTCLKRRSLYFINEHNIYK